MLSARFVKENHHPVYSIHLISYDLIPMKNQKGLKCAVIRMHDHRRVYKVQSRGMIRLLVQGLE